MPRYGIAGLVPRPWSTAVEAIRSGCDIWSKVWLPPHITVVRPFDAELLPNVIDRIHRRTVHLRVTLQGWGSFRRPDSNVIWLDPGQKEGQQVQGVALEILRAAGHVLPAEGTFHITAVNHIPDAYFGDTWDLVTVRSVTGSFVIRRLRVFVQLANGEWDLVPIDPRGGQDER